MRVLPRKSKMPPPLPCLIGLGIGVLVNWFWPWPIARYLYVLPVGILLVVGVVVLSIALANAFKRHGTPPDPDKETTAIVDTGPFRYSRNPAYLAAVMLQISLAFLFNNAWILVMAVPAITVIHYVVVLREEAYLEDKFGDEYLSYKHRVRRWV